MRLTGRPPYLAIVSVACALLCGCSTAPGQSHAGDAYHGKLPDDTLAEAATTVLVTKREVVVALDCRPLSSAIARGDTAALQRAVDAGIAVRLPANVTLYTLPFSEKNPQAAPLVVTDDKYAGTLCTPDAYDVVKS